MSQARKSECPGGAGQIAKQNSESSVIIARDARAGKVEVMARISEKQTNRQGVETTLPPPGFDDCKLIPNAGRKWRAAKTNTRAPGTFNRNKLPHPAEYYADEGVTLLGKGRWRNALCPFHQDSRPSLRVFIETGAFRCMACGAHGGDVLAFHMLRHGMRFIEAAKALDAWEVSP